MTEHDRDELQRLAKLVEVNRERLHAMEQQVQNLENIRIEQTQAMEALGAIEKEGAKGIMVPLGAGIQLIADIPPDAGAVVDVGSRVQAEKTREEAKNILKTRNEELLRIIDSIRDEYDELEAHVVEMANQFNGIVEKIQANSVDSDDPILEEASPNKRRRRRKRGTELTLDD